MNDDLLIYFVVRSQDEGRLTSGLHFRVPALQATRKSKYSVMNTLSLYTFDLITLLFLIVIREHGYGGSEEGNI